MVEKDAAWRNAEGEMVYFYPVSDRASPYGPHGLWYYPNGHFGEPNKTKFEAPYSYSPFFIHGDHKSIKGANCDYTDRFSLWGKEKFDAAIKAVGRKCRWDQMTKPELQRFADAYYGDGKYTVVGLVEWCNASNGYPCWSIHYREAP